MSDFLDEENVGLPNSPDMQKGNCGQYQVPQDMERLKEIPKWTRRYAESRTVPLIVISMAFIVLFGLVFLGVYCFLHGKFFLGSVMMILYVASFIHLLLTSDRYEGRYFTKTGIPQSESVKQIRKFLPLPLITCIVISVIMEQWGVFPHHLSVPISALYVCPLLIFANWRWARGSFIGHLWAALYGAWAIAILFKVPILTFSQGGQLKPGDEMFLAAPVTGVITGLVAYIYNRNALNRLKKSARTKQDDTTMESGLNL